MKPYKKENLALLVQQSGSLSIADDDSGQTIPSTSDKKIDDEIVTLHFKVNNIITAALKIDANSLAVLQLLQYFIHWYTFALNKLISGRTCDLTVYAPTEKNFWTSAQSILKEVSNTSISKSSVLDDWKSKIDKFATVNTMNAGPTTTNDHIVDLQNFLQSDSVNKVKENYPLRKQPSNDEIKANSAEISPFTERRLSFSEGLREAQKSINTLDRIAQAKSLLNAVVGKAGYLARKLESDDKILRPFKL